MEAHKHGSSLRGWALLFALVLLIAGVLYYRSAQAKKQAQSAAAAAVLAANAPVSVVIAAAKSGTLPVYLSGLGTITPLSTVTVHTRVDGQLNSVAFREGEFVHKGDLLAQIDPRPYQVQLTQAQGALAKDQASQKDAIIDQGRYDTLWKEGVIPRQQYDTQIALVGQYDGSIKADQGLIDSAKLNLLYCRITAPVSGRIGLRLVDPGNIVHAADAGGLLVITQVQPIAVIFSLPQEQLPQVYNKIRAGAKLPVELYGQDNVTRLGTGELLTIDNQIDPTTGTYKLKATFANADNALFPNQFVNTRLLVDERSGLTLVPAAAVQRGPQGTYVYAVGPNNTVELRPVTVAITEGNTAGLSSGLSPRESVVIDGQDKLQNGSRIIPRSPSPTSPSAQAQTAPRNGSQPVTPAKPGAQGQ